MSTANPIAKSLLMALITCSLAVIVKLANAEGFVFDPITMLACPAAVFAGAMIGYRRRH